jgi:hypothetical protein
MATREITGVLRDLNGQPYADETVSVSFSGPSATPDGTYVTSHRTYRTGADGRITETVQLYANEAGDQASHYLIRMGADTFKAVVPVGEGPLSWSELRALGVTESDPQFATLDTRIQQRIQEAQLDGVDTSGFATAEQLEAHRLDANPHPNFAAPGGVSSWNDLTDKPTEFPPTAHTHVQSDVTGLADALAGKETAGAAAAAINAHTSATDPHPQYLTQTEADALYSAGTVDGGSVTWTSITGKPTVFPPEAHTHTISEVAGLEVELAAKLETVSYAEVTDKPATFPPDAHTHVISDTTGLQAALDGKAPATHSHAIADVTGLQGALDGKAATSHTHDDRYYTETETNTLLAGKANTSHTHAIADTAGLQAALDGKAATSHTHVIGDTTGLQATLDGKEATGTAAAAVSAHTSATDPHTGYQLRSEKGQANGYASLVSGKVPSAQITVIEKLAFAATGSYPIPFTVARTLAAPTVLSNASAPTITYRYAATPSGASTVISTWPHAAAAGSWVLVEVTNMGTSTLATVEISTS